MTVVCIQYFVLKKFNFFENHQFWHAKKIKKGFLGFLVFWFFGFLVFVILLKDGCSAGWAILAWAARLFCPREYAVCVELVILLPRAVAFGEFVHTYGAGLFVNYLILDDDSGFRLWFWTWGIGVAGVAGARWMGRRSAGLSGARSVLRNSSGNRQTSSIVHSPVCTRRSIIILAITIFLTSWVGSTYLYPGKFLNSVGLYPLEIR